MDTKTITSRTEMVLGHELMGRLAEIRVIIFGLGGVGSWCAESLIRTGVLHLTIVDSDIICPTNINRQAQALSINTGLSKVEEMRIRLLSINPSAEINAVHGVYSEETDPGFNLESYDYVVDAIDSLKNKIYLIKRCRTTGLKVFSSMGAAAKSDPTRIKIEKLSKTVNCPLARLVRRALKKEKISTDFLCVYSDEIPVKPQSEALCASQSCACASDRECYNANADTEAVDWCARKKRINGALVHITGAFGFFLTSMIINDLKK